MIRFWMFCLPLMSAGIGLACNDEPTGPLRPDVGLTDSGRELTDAMVLDARSVGNELCADARFADDLVVAAGETLTVCAGVTLTMETGTSIVVAGTLRLQGTESEHVQINGDPRWSGFRVAGSLQAEFTDVYDAALAVDGESDSSIVFEDSLIYARGLRSLVLGNGGQFNRTEIFGGTSVQIDAGLFAMTDSTLDLDHPGLSPDCTNFDGGGADFDHVTVTNCHCPIHVNRADLPFNIENSVLDGSVYPVMIANANGSVINSVLIGTEVAFLDIGGSIDLDISGNYYGGGPATVRSDNEAQFRGGEAYESERPIGVGPR